MKEIESSFNTSNISSNRAYQGATALQIRLQTNELIENIEMFLRGTMTITEQDESGNIFTRQILKGQPKANDLGIQSLLNWIQLILNTQVVQGNFPSESKGRSDMYTMYIYNVRMDLAHTIILNCYNWEIEDDDITMIIDSILNAVEPFMTRLIDNKERESYDATVKHVEHSTLKEGQSGFKFLGGKI